MSWMPFVSLLALVALAVPSSSPQKRRDPLPESFTATAQFIGTGGAAATTFKMRVERYRFRGAQISTPYNIDEVDPDGARFRRTSHDDVAFVGQVSEYLT